MSLEEKIRKAILSDTHMKKYRDGIKDKIKQLKAEVDRLESMLGEDSFYPWRQTEAEKIFFDFVREEKNKIGETK